MKKIIVITLSFLFLSCNGNVDNNKDNDWNSIDHLQNICEEFMIKIDSTATVNVSSTLNSDTIQFSFGNISKINDSPEFSELFKEYILAKIYIQNQKVIPNSVMINVNFSRGINYSYDGKLMPHRYERLNDKEFVNYVEFLLKNVHPNESAYFDITIPVIKEFYVHYDYNGTLLSLLLDFYFVEENQNVKIWFFVFYGNCDFRDGDFEFDKTLLNKILTKKGFAPEEWTFEQINHLYMDTYEIDTIKTIQNEIYFTR